MSYLLSTTPLFFWKYVPLSLRELSLPSYNHLRLILDEATNNNILHLGN